MLSILSTIKKKNILVLQLSHSSITDFYIVYPKCVIQFRQGHSLMQTEGLWRFFIPSIQSGPVIYVLTLFFLITQTFLMQTPKHSRHAANASMKACFGQCFLLSSFLKIVKFVFSVLVEETISNKRSLVLSRRREEIIHCFLWDTYSLFCWIPGVIMLVSTRR